MDHVGEFINKVQAWTMPDDSNVLLGTEQKIAQCIEDNALMAVAIRDIFDKKAAQKILRKWLSIPKVKMSPKFSQLYHGKQDSTKEAVEQCLEMHSIQLTAKQRTAEWFTLHSFHLTATMASKLLCQMNES